VFYRRFLREEKRPLRFKKVKGTSAIEGQIFEYKVCALTFIKAINKGLEFKLGCNVEGFGVFDDVVLEYLDASGRTSHICVQLKRKERQRIAEKQLLAKSGDFSLIRHYESYTGIEKTFKSREQGDETKGSIDDCLFIIYTNADVEERLKSDTSAELGQEEFLNAGGYVLKFCEEKHKDIYEHMKEKPRYREFLSRYRIMYKQADEKRMDHYIIPPLQEILKFPDSERKSACQYFCDFVMGWWQKEDKPYFLQDTNLKENDPLLKTSENVGKTVIARIPDHRKSEFEDLSIKYEKPAIKYMKQLTKSHKAVLIFASGTSTIITTAKIHQMLSATEHIILNLQQLIRYKSEVMFAWKSMFDVLVLESNSSAEVSPDLFKELSGFLNDNFAEKKLIENVAGKRFIFISNTVGNTQQIHELRNIFRGDLTEGYDSCKFTDIVTESRMLFLNKNVCFQGSEVKLSTIVKNDDVHLLNELDCESISLLLENEKPSIGMRTEDTVKYYIDRTLQCRKQANTRFTAQGEIQHASSGDILQDVGDSSPKLEENLGKEAATDWKPRTLL
jgi:hypothetical protein